MADLAKLISGPSAPGSRNQVLRGRVRRTPAAPDDRLVVSLDSISTEIYEVPPGNWTPRGSELPQQGALCLVLLDEFGEAYVPAYSGVNGFAEGAFAFFNG